MDCQENFLTVIFIKFIFVVVKLIWRHNEALIYYFFSFFYNELCF